MREKGGERGRERDREDYYLLWVLKERGKGCVLGPLASPLCVSQPDSRPLAPSKFPPSIDYHWTSGRPSFSLAIFPRPRL